MLGSLYADKYGLEVFLIRIGYASRTPDDLHGLAMWVSPRDLAQLVAIGIDHPDVHFDLTRGRRPCARGWLLGRAIRARKIIAYPLYSGGLDQGLELCALDQAMRQLALRLPGVYRVYYVKTCSDRLAPRAHLSFRACSAVGTSHAPPVR